MVTRVNGPQAPALPVAPIAFERRYHDQLNNILRLYFNQLDDALDVALGPVRGPFDYVDFNETATYPAQLARVGWSSADQTLQIGMDYGVIQQVGQETYARVENSTGSTIPNGSLVGFAGAGALSTLQVAPYLADGASPSLYVLGVMTHELPDSGQKGYCTVWGNVRDLNTTGAPYGETWSVGDILYASPTVAGGFTNIKPTAPNNVVPVAAVVAVSATVGEIFVRPTVQQMQYYGTFAKTDSQSPVAINTEYLLTFTNTQISNGVVIGSPASRIVVPQSGLYRFDANLQLTSSSSSQKAVWVWFKKNGTAVPNSARILTTDINSGYLPLTLQETISLGANQYVELAFASDSTAVSVSSVASTAFAPAAPAIVLNVTQAQQ
jgi:hypothetical protein